MRHFILLLALLISQFLTGQTRWNIADDGSIRWDVAVTGLPHYDHIEMSGEQVSVVFRYGVNNDGSFSLERSVIWPMLRTVPNDTHASLMQRFRIDVPSLLMINGRALSGEKVKSVILDGVLTVTSEYSSPVPVQIIRSCFPSTVKPLICEKYTVKNNSGKSLMLLIPSQRTVYHTDPAKGVRGSYTTEILLNGSGTFNLVPGDERSFEVVIQASSGENLLNVDASNELALRREFVTSMWSNLVLKTPDAAIDRMFAFAKIRAAESIYRTAGGLMHGPGGESYYAAIWANDQAEYVGPFFPFLGYQKADEASLNAYMHFARFMNDEFKPIPSSIIAEGKDIWNGAGDRGDAAMIAYGAARYALARGDRQEAEKLWPLIEWCLEYCRRKLNDRGVVTSDSDELEGRFPSGDANLCTSTLYYDALLSASYLGNNLNKDKRTTGKYVQQARILKSSINSYFGSTIDGFETYRYYDGNTVLRSWICMPLVVGIHERAAGTINALFSPTLWTKNGLLTQAGSETFWDRSTLYALRGVYAAGETGKATDYLKFYSGQRLLGEHVPYAIEAWPEGSQRHLSAESGLYCRIITEGLFGIRPAGLKSFFLTPRLPVEWPSMELDRIHAFGADFNISVKREGTRLRVAVTRHDNSMVFNGIIKESETIEVKL